MHFRSVALSIKQFKDRIVKTMAFRLRLARRKTKKTKGVLANEQSGFFGFKGWKK